MIAVSISFTIIKIMTKRRDFLKTSGTLALSGLLMNQFSDAFALPKSKPVGLQLFTLFSILDQDVKGNLKKVADIGFKEVESAFSLKGGYYGMKPTEFKALLTQLGLTWRSHHAIGAPFKPQPGFDMSKMPKMMTLKTDAQQIADDLASVGVKYMVCAAIPIETSDEVKEAVDILSKAGEIAKKNGLTLCYHNHDKEFAVVDGQKAYDVFLSQISADLMKFELDLAWVSKAGVDPVELFKKYPKRFPLWHVKDFDKEYKTLMPVGEGVIDFKRIFAAASTAGMQHFFVEHDMPAKPFDSITSSINYLHKTVGV
jgi:sugar phosphate isomerase/epimerase